MNAIQMLVLPFVLCGVMSSHLRRFAELEPASQPADPNVVQWRFHCDLEDGRRLITDGALIVEARLAPKAAIPEKSLPPTAPLRLMASPTDHEFALSDLENTAPGGHYVSPRGIQIHRKYVELLRDAPSSGTLRFRAKGVSDPVLIVEGDKVVGVVMPMKKS